MAASRRRADTDPDRTGASGGRESVPRADALLTERHVLSLGLAFSAAFVACSAVAATIAGMTADSAWAAIHLALVGSATVAIGAFMPHFAVTLAGTRPAPSGQRLAVRRAALRSTR